VHQYLAQASLMARWGVVDLAERFGADAQDELDHQRRIVDVMVATGTPFRGIDVPPPRLGRTVEAILQVDRELEVEVIRLYEEAASYCERFHHHFAHELFAALLDEELHHLADIDELVAQVRSGAGLHG